MFGASSVLLKAVDAEDRSYDVECVPGTEVCITVERSSFFIILAHYGSEIPCAGAVLPWDGDEEAYLSFTRGFCSELLLDLQAAGGSPEQVNYPVLLEKTMEISAGNPGRLDRQRLLAALMLGNLVSRDIVLLPEYTLPAGSLPGGSWLPVEPLGELVSDGVWGRFRQGRTLYFNGEYTLAVCCDSKGWTAYSDPAWFFSSGCW